MKFNSSITDIHGVGQSAATLFAQIGITTVKDLVDYYPRTYNDFSTIESISKIKPGQVTICAKIAHITGRYVRRGMHITEAIASDASSSIRIVWFNQPYRAQSIDAGKKYFISGTFELSHQKFAILNPSIEKESDFPINTARIVPVYKETKGLKSSRIRNTIKQLVPLIQTTNETLPEWLVHQHGLLSRSEALQAIHFPDDMQQLQKAKHRLGFEEVFELTLAALLNKQESLKGNALSIPFQQNIAKAFVAHLPFTLTDDQKKVIWRIYEDLQKKQPMNRLIEGDVGSGKTVVATMVALMAIQQGYQVALMAPTELLARQHADTIYRLLEPLDYQHHVSLLVGGMSTKQKSVVHSHIKSGIVRFIIGTHALIQDSVDMHKLGLVIIDEQHRFGVEQRKKLQIKAGHMPHVMSMTATPIPRSLALTLYGELDISVIASKPNNRLPIITKLISPNSRASLYAKIDEQIEKGRQVYVVCPLITDSLTMSESKSVEEVYKSLTQGPFKHRRVALLHGKMKPHDKSAVMQKFVNHEFDILVSTTVIEVGVDVPNATIIVIENADRFGLAQLHQLRGRVGRNHYQGYAYPVLSDSKAPSKRLLAFERTSDGFKLAELDLSLRGPGAIYGTFQHGLLDLRIATLSDTTLIEQARSSAQQFINLEEKLLQYTHLAKRVNLLRAVTNLN